MRKILFFIALITLCIQPAYSAGLLRPANSAHGDLVIREHRVNVVINNGFAVTEVDQTFANPHAVDLEAIYTFPLPRQASMSELSLWIDGVETIGEVVEKEAARKIVQSEQAAGRQTALAEKRDYLAFDVFVSPVRAGADVRVRLVYLQPIEIDGGMGRYVYPLQEGEIDDREMSFWNRSERVEGKFSFEATIRSSYPLDDVRTKGLGNSTVTQEATGEWKVWIDDTESPQVELNRDIIVYYRLAQDQPARVDLLPYRDPSSGEDGTYMLVITPGADLAPAPEGVDWTVVLDVSGSMGSKIAQASDAVSQALSNMRPNDRFRVLTFANDVVDITRGFQTIDENRIRAASALVKQQGVRGGTNLYAGFMSGLNRLDADRSNAVLFVSDGGANVGPTQLSQFSKVLDTVDVRVFTFVMGQGSNRPLLEGIAKASGGFSMDVSNEDDLYGRVLQAKEKLASRALHGVDLKLRGVKAHSAAPGKLPNAYLGEQIVQFGRYSQPGRTTLKLSARISGEDREWSTEVELPESDQRFPEIERLWALARIDDMQEAVDRGESESEYRDTIVAVATEHSIVSNYTSMVVMREEQFEQHGVARNNRDRVQKERAARTKRAATVQQTRADTSAPMFENKRSHSTGGGGAGAAGPWFVGLILGLGGYRRWSSRRKPSA